MYHGPVGGQGHRNEDVQRVYPYLGACEPGIFWDFSFKKSDQAVL